ncbi:MAG TPA: glycosyltransferase family 39 protein [Candidatus Binatia bacterium]
MTITKKVLVLVLLSLLTIGGCYFRAQRLAGVEGKLGEDETRLMLAAEGVLTTGLPTMPSGKIYLRGALSSYLTAASLWLFGRDDFAARLPNALAGALLIPLFFVFGRALGGTTAGFCLALFAAVQPELIKWSANAWMTMLFIVVFIGAAYLLYLGYERDRPPMQVAGAAAGLFAVLAHELGALLAVAVALALAIRAARRDFGWFSGSRSVAALLILGFSLILVVALGLFLRLGTVVGSTGEFKHYIDPYLSLDRLLIDYKRWRGGYLPLAAAAILGIPLLLRSLRSGGLFLYMIMAVTCMTVWVIIGKTSERYGLVLLPVLALAATWALAEVARLVSGWQRIGARTALAFRAVVFVVAFGASLHRDLLAATQRPDPPTETWLTEFRSLGAAPGDLVLCDNPEIPAWYLGRVDYWDRGPNYERYSYISGNQIRHLYTGAVRVGSEEDFFRLIEANETKILWYLGKEPALKILSPHVRSRLLGSPQRLRRTRDEQIILRIDLSALDWMRVKGN